MNRRMRNRTYGGVRGRRGQLRPLLDYDFGVPAVYLADLMQVKKKWAPPA